MRALPRSAFGAAVVGFFSLGGCSGDADRDDSGLRAAVRDSLSADSRTSREPSIERRLATPTRALIGASTEPAPSEPLAPGSVPAFDAPAQLGEPSDRVLQLLGGQTGSDSVPESLGPCTPVNVGEYALSDVTPLGFSGNDVRAALAAAAEADITVRWSSGEPVTARLAMSAAPIATFVDRVPSAEGIDCLDVLHLSVTVRLSSDESGVSGTWVTNLYASSPEEVAGDGEAAASALGAGLLARSGDPESLWLTFELDAGTLNGWLSAPGEPSTIVAEF